MRMYACTCVSVAAELRTHQTFFAPFPSALKPHIPRVTVQTIESHARGYLLLLSRGRELSW